MHVQQLLLLPPTLILTCQPFLPPSGTDQNIVLPTMMAEHARMVATGRTGAPYVVGTTQGTHVTDTGEVQNNDVPRLPRGIVTPVRVNNLRDLLHLHPDRDLVEFILQGFTVGFDVGFRGSFTNHNTRPRNLLSARQRWDCFLTPPSHTHIALLLAQHPNLMAPLDL